MKYRAMALPVSIFLVTVFMLERPSVARAADPLPQLTAATPEQWMASLSNWGRWGEDDQQRARHSIRWPYFKMTML